MTEMGKKIYTRFGTEVRIIGKDPRWPDVPWVAAEDIDEGGTPTGNTRWVSIADLRGSDGWQTVAIATERAPIAVYEEGRDPIILPTIQAVAIHGVGQPDNGPVLDEWPFTARHGDGDEGDPGLTEDYNDD